MKLRCGHKRRVLVLPHQIEVREGLLLDHTTVHRNDGSECNSQILWLGNHPLNPLGIVLLSTQGQPLHEGRRGKPKVQRDSTIDGREVSLESNSIVT